MEQQKKKDNGEKIDTTPLKKGMAIGFFMAFIGLITLMIQVALMPGDIFDNLTTIFGHAYDMTALEQIGIPSREAVVIMPFTNEVELITLYQPFYTNLIWLSFFFMVTGAQLGAICLVLRLVEFRGKSTEFAKKTLLIRRFGFVAFSIYTFQYIDVLMVYLFNNIIGIPYFGMGIYDPAQIWGVLILILLEWSVVLWLWEKISYAFGMEWFIAKISEIIVPSKKKARGVPGMPWWKTSRLDPKASLHDAEWLEIINKDEIDHENLKESKLTAKIALCGFIFFPAFFVALGLIKTAEKTENSNEYTKKAKIIAIIGSILTVIGIILLLILNVGLLF